eukprot:scaffold17670_cov99-Cyclotella_meneghiniana.AAC.3
MEKLIVIMTGYLRGVSDDSICNAMRGIGRYHLAFRSAVLGEEDRYGIIGWSRNCDHRVVDGLGRKRRAYLIIASSSFEAIRI